MVLLAVDSTGVLVNDVEPPKIDVLPNEKVAVVFGTSDVAAGLPKMFLPGLNEKVGALTSVGSLLLVLKLNLPKGDEVDVVNLSADDSTAGVAFDAPAFVNELNENVALAADDDDIFFDRLLLGT